jgi:hypothetical protein
VRIPSVNAIQRAAVALGLGLGALGSAQAGLVSGAWDPLFGPFLANLSWSGQAQFYVPDTCSTQADGVHPASGLCGGVTVNFANVKFFDAATTPTGDQIVDFATLGFTVTGVKLWSNQVVAVVTNPAAGVANPTGAPAAQGNLFGLEFTPTSPMLWCIACGQAGPDFNNPNLSATVNGMEQTFVTYLDNGDPKLVDAFGNPVGVKLDGQGTVIGYTSPPVPEPATWALMLGGLVAVSALRRRRR